MINGLLAGGCTADGWVITDITLEETEVPAAVEVLQPGQIGCAASSRQIIEQSHFVPGLNAGIGQVAANEAGTTRDQDAACLPRLHATSRDCHT